MNKLQTFEYYCTIQNYYLYTLDPSRNNYKNKFVDKVLLNHKPIAEIAQRAGCIDAVRLQKNTFIFVI